VIHKYQAKNNKVLKIPFWGQNRTENQYS